MIGANGLPITSQTSEAATPNDDSKSSSGTSTSRLSPSLKPSSPRPLKLNRAVTVVTNNIVIPGDDSSSDSPTSDSPRRRPHKKKKEPKELIDTITAKELKRIDTIFNTLSEFDLVLGKTDEEAKVIGKFFATNLADFKSITGACLNIPGGNDFENQKRYYIQNLNEGLDAIKRKTNNGIIFEESCLSSWTEAKKSELKLNDEAIKKFKEKMEKSSETLGKIIPSIKITSSTRKTKANRLALHMYSQSPRKDLLSPDSPVSAGNDNKNLSTSFSPATPTSLTGPATPPTPIINLLSPSSQLNNGTGSYVASSRVPSFSPESVWEILTPKQQKELIDIYFALENLDNESFKTDIYGSEQKNSPPLLRIEKLRFLETKNNNILEVIDQKLNALKIYIDRIVDPDLSALLQRDFKFKLNVKDRAIDNQERIKELSASPDNKANKLDSKLEAEEVYRPPVEEEKQPKSRIIIEPKKPDVESKNAADSKKPSEIKPVPKLEKDIPKYQLLTLITQIIADVNFWKSKLKYSAKLFKTVPDNLLKLMHVVRPHIRLDNNKEYLDLTRVSVNQVNRTLKDFSDVADKSGSGYLGCFKNRDDATQKFYNILKRLKNIENNDNELSEIRKDILCWLDESHDESHPLKKKYQNEISKAEKNLDIDKLMNRDVTGRGYQPTPSPTKNS